MSNLVTLITEISIVVSVLIPIGVIIFCLINGMKCLLRSEMLRTYYHNKGKKRFDNSNLKILSIYIRLIKLSKVTAS